MERYKFGGIRPKMSEIQVRRDHKKTAVQNKSKKKNRIVCMMLLEREGEREVYHLKFIGDERFDLVNEGWGFGLRHWM